MAVPKHMVGKGGGRGGPARTWVLVCVRVLRRQSLRARPLHQDWGPHRASGVESVDTVNCGETARQSTDPRALGERRRQKRPVLSGCCWERGSGLVGKGLGVPGGHTLQTHELHGKKLIFQTEKEALPALLATRPVLVNLHGVGSSCGFKESAASVLPQAEGLQPPCAPRG